MPQGGGIAPPPIFNYELSSAIKNQTGSRMGTATRLLMVNRGGGRPISMGMASGPARPMTAVRAAGYSSAGVRSNC